MTATGFDVLRFCCLLHLVIINVSSLPSRSHNGSVVDASGDVEAIDWSCCQCVFVDVVVDVDVEIAKHNVALIDVVVVHIVVVVDGVAAFAGGTKNWACRTRTYLRKRLKWEKEDAAPLAVDKTKL
jgi:hypothetical protein